MKQFSLQHCRHISQAHKKRGTMPPSRLGSFIDLSGQMFGRLKVLNLNGRSANRQTLWRCRCECGNQVTVRRDALIDGATGSCGCLHHEIVTKHNHANKGRYSLTYHSWQQMIQRCENKNNRAYHCYGGRNIIVHPPWHDFVNFLTHLKATIGLRSVSEYTLDRINNNGNYEPGNIRWATKKEQNRNMRKTIKINGVPLAELAEKNGLAYETVRQRLKRGWSVDQLFQPIEERYCFTVR